MSLERLTENLSATRFVELTCQNDRHLRRRENSTRDLCLSRVMRKCLEQAFLP